MPIPPRPLSFSTYFQPFALFPGLVCISITLQVLRQGSSRQSFFHQGVPWFRLTEALQEELKKVLLDAMRSFRISPSSSTAPMEVANSTQDQIRGLESTDIQFIKSKLVSRLIGVNKHHC